MLKEEHRHNLILALSVVATALLAILLVFTLTRPALSPIFDFSKTGTIGDTIGGITAPMFNLLGAILIYLSFRQQYKANQIQIKALNSAREFSNIENLISQIIKEVDILEIKYTVTRGSSKAGVKPVSKDYAFYGLTAIEIFAEQITEGSAGSRILNFTQNLIYVLDIIKFTSSKIENYQYDRSDREYLTIRMVQLWEGKLNPRFIEVCKSFIVVRLFDQTKNEKIKTTILDFQNKIAAVSNFMEKHSAALEAQ